MPVGLYMDQHVPRVITIGLRLEIVATAGEPEELRQQVLFLPL